MKKIYMFIMLMLLIGVSGCEEEKPQLKIIVPEGNPLVAVGGLLSDEAYEFDAVNGSPLLKAAFTQNEYDVIIAPFNLGVQLYNANNSTYKLAAVIGFSNTYIVTRSTNPLESLNDLSSLTMLAYGMGSTPAIVLQYALDQNDVSVNIEYQNAVSDVIPLFIQNEYQYILAAEPAISNLKINKNLSLNTLDLQQYVDVEIMQVGVFMKSDCDGDEFLKDLKNNMQQMNSDVDTYVDNIIEKNTYFSDLGKDVLVNSIPNFNMQYKQAKSIKSEINDFLKVINLEIKDEEIYY